MRSSDGINFSQVASVNSTNSTLSYTDNVSTCTGKVYYYKIQSVNPEGTANSSIIIIGFASCSNTSNINYTASSQVKAYQYTTGTITAGTNITIGNGTIVGFYAGSGIQLLSGFSAVIGSTFQAQIVACTSNTQSAMKDSLGNNSITDVPAVNTGTIKIYPNPTTGLLTIETGENKATIGIYNIYGSLLKLQQLTGNINQTDISNLAAGTYIIKVVTNSGQQKEQLIIKK